jgi:hypothetical protein
MSYQPWADVNLEDVEAQADANETREHLKLVRGYMNAETDGEEDGRLDGLCRVFSSQTSAASHVIAQVLDEPTPRALLDALIGATGGRDEFVEVTDDALAAELGCSTRTIQTYRKQLRAMPNYTLLVDIKEHWRDPKTGESHPHSYHVHVTRHAIEAEQNARLSPGWNGDAESQLRALAESAEMVVRGATPAPPRKAKKRKKLTDAELMLSKVKQSASALSAATALSTMARGVDRQQLRELRAELQKQLEAFDAALGFESPVSMQDTDLRSMEAVAEPAAPLLPVSPPERRVETASEGDENASWVEKFSTQNDSTESKTYGEAPAGEPPSKLYLDEVAAVYERKVAEGLPEDEAAEVARDEVGEFETWKTARLRVWDAAFAGLKGGVVDARS